MPTSSTPTPDPRDSHAVAARAEYRWALFVIAIIGFLLFRIGYTSLHWIRMPARRVETVNPSTLHLFGEFVEDNLGSAVEPDGSVTVRIVGQQYSFNPPCILVPANTAVNFRVTSADVIHGFIIAGTNVNVMLEPGYISNFHATFKKPGKHVMPCHEFCGVGHAGMWAHVEVIERDNFFRQARDERRLSCVNK